MSHWYEDFAFVFHFKWPMHVESALLADMTDFTPQSHTAPYRIDQFLCFRAFPSSL